MKNYKINSIIMILLMAFALFVSYFSLGERQIPLLFETSLASEIEGVQNFVMNIYLRYRLFDTLFEAMLLLVCVMGVLQFSSLNAKENNFIEKNRSQLKNFSELMSEGLKTVYPLVFLFGIYIIIFGLNSPGGGFQGGAIVAAIIMSLHLSTGKSIMTVENAIKLEKVMFILLLIISSIFFILGFPHGKLYIYFLIIINVIIGIKVFCGFVIIYLHFMHKGGNKIKYF